MPELTLDFTHACRFILAWTKVKKGKFSKLCCFLGAHKTMDRIFFVLFLECLFISIFSKLNKMIGGIPKWKKFWDVIANLFLFIFPILIYFLLSMSWLCNYVSAKVKYKFVLFYFFLNLKKERIYLKKERIYLLWLK